MKKYKVYGFLAWLYVVFFITSLFWGNGFDFQTRGSTMSMWMYCIGTFPLVAGIGLGSLVKVNKKDDKDS